MTREDQYGHLYPSSKTQCLLTEIIIVSPRYPETIESNSTRRHLMVIRIFRQLEASEPIDPQRPIWSSAPFFEDSMSIDRDYFSLYFAIWRQSSPIACGGRNGHSLSVFWDYQSPLYHPVTSESDDIRDDHGRPFQIVLEIFAAPFVILRQSSPMMHKDSLLLSRDDQV